MHARGHTPQTDPLADVTVERIAGIQRTNQAIFVNLAVALYWRRSASTAAKLASSPFFCEITTPSPPFLNASFTSCADESMGPDALVALPADFPESALQKAPMARDVHVDIVGKSKEIWRYSGKTPTPQTTCIR